MSNRLNDVSKAVVNDFKGAEGHSDAARNLINHIQDDREQYGSSGSWKKELSRINSELHDSGALPKVSLDGGTKEMKITMLTSEKGLSHGVVLSSGEGANRKDVILTEGGKYVEGQVTKRGIVAKPNGQEYYKDENGVLQVKEKGETGDSTVPSEADKRKENRDATRNTHAPDAVGPEHSLDYKERTAKASELLQMATSGDSPGATEGLQKLNIKDRQAVVDMMEKQYEMARKQQSWGGWMAGKFSNKYDFGQLNVEYEQMGDGQPYPVGVSIKH